MALFFFNPTRYFGGASVLFSRVFDFFKSRSECFYIDCDNGFYTERCIDKQNVLSCDRVDEIKSVMTNDDVVVCISTQIPNLMSLLGEIKLNPKVVIWVVHPFEASLNFFPLARLIKESLGYTITKLYLIIFFKRYFYVREFIKKNFGDSLFFMDSANLRATNYFLNLHLSEDKNCFLQIPYKESVSGCEINKFDSGSLLELAYFGRVEDFKLNPLVALLNDVVDNNDFFHFKFTVIGDGKGLSYIKSKFQGKIDINFLGYMENDKARSYIAENVDILFAMGTAALDGASLGVPTVLIHPSNTLRKQKYNWLFNTKNYDLGDYLDAPWFREHGMLFHELVKMMDSNKKEISLKSFNYVVENHDILKVVEKLDKVISEVSLRAGSLESISKFSVRSKFLRKSFWRRVKFL